MSAAVHDFRDSLEYSHSQDGADFWPVVYEYFFPGHAAIIRHSQDGWHQRAGIDVSVVMPDSKTYLIDEKIRFRDYGDFALEEWSDYTRRVPGWIQKPLAADFILYAIPSTSAAFLLPVLQLQNSWRIHGETWKETAEFIKSSSRNNGRTWSSICWGVERAAVLTAISEQHSFVSCN